MKNERLSLLIYLTKSELQRRNSGTIGGSFYTVLAPLILIFVMWFALDYGLGMRALVGPSFGIKVVIGMALWVTFSAAIMEATHVITSNPHLVKKVVFPVELLPAASVLGAFFVHIAILLSVIIGLAVSGHLSLQALWWLPIAFLWSLVISMSYALIFSSLNVILKDTQVFVQIFVSIWFWITPIIWQISSVPDKWQWAVGLNPIAIPTELYKHALLGTEFTLGFVPILIAVITTVILLILGTVIFKLLRPSFADKL